MSEYVRLPQPAQKALEKFPIAMTDTIDYISQEGIRHETISLYRL